MLHLETPDTLTTRSTSPAQRAGRHESQHRQASEDVNPFFGPSNVRKEYFADSSTSTQSSSIVVRCSENESLFNLQTFQLVQCNPIPPMKHISPLIQGVVLERFVLIVRQHFGGIRHHRFWLQRQNMDVCPAHSSSWRCSPLKSGHYFYSPSFLFVFDVCCVAARECLRGFGKPSRFSQSVQAPCC